MKLAIVIIALGMLGACKRGSDTETPDAEKLLPPGEYLLYEPTADAKGLLGKQVVWKDGAYTVADYLKPGCRVESKPSEDEYHRIFADRAQNVIAGSANVGQVARLSAAHESVTVTMMDIKNTRILRANLKGPCGDNVITKVKVGEGRRRVFRKTDTSAEVGFRIPSTNIEAGLEAQGFEDAGLYLRWPEEKAWGFELGGDATEDGVRLQVTVEPDVVTDGERYEVRVHADEGASLVVIARENSGRAAVLIPAMQGGEIHQIQLVAEQWLTLPSATATLKDPAVEQRDTLIVYGVRHLEDIEALDLNLGDMSDADRTAQAERVIRELDALPLQRFQRNEVGYRIVPAQRTP